MIPFPYNIVAGLALILGVFFTGWHYGGKNVQADWDKEKVALLEKEKNLILENEARNAAILEEQKRKNIEVTNAHFKEIANINAAYDKRLRLTIKGGSCNLPAETSSASTGTSETGIVLPQQTSDDLLNLTREADEVNSRLRACQSWIKENGF